MGDIVQFPMTNDSLRSMVAGLGDPLRDKMAAASYGMTFLDDFQLAAIYKSNWLGRKIIDIPAMDSIRKGRDWQAEQDQIEAIEAEEVRLNLWGKLLEVRTKARLWGGAALFIGTGDQDLMQPLRPERIKKGGIKYLKVLSRRDIAAGAVDQDVLSEFHGWPAHYDVTGAQLMVRIHPSRLAIFTGAPHGDSLLAMGVNQGWGDSILEAVYSAMKHADATAANIASLIFEANVDVFRIPEFMNGLSDPAYSNRLIERFTLAATAKGINRALILDKEEEYERKTISFATLPEVMQTFLQMAAGAADIPVTRLLGQSPSGMSSTGESDIRNYYDRLSSEQSLIMSPAMHRLDECLIYSALGSRPKEIHYRWSPLWQLSDKEKAEIGKMNAETANTWATTGLFTQDELRSVSANQLVESGFYPGIEDAMDETGEDWQSELEPDEPEIVEPPVNNVTRMQRAANDALPRTLYIRRDVINVSDITAWANAQGFGSVQDGLHVTIIHTRTPMDWIKVGADSEWSGGDGKLEIAPGGPRLMERFGDAIVLQFASSRLTWRHEDIKRMGAETDYPDYQPHVTVTWKAPEIDLTKIEPYKGKIVLGPEIFEEVNDDWKTTKA